MIRTLMGFDYDVINVHFNLLMNHVVENSHHGSHVGGTDVLEEERHHPVVIYTPRCNESCFFHVFLIHQNLVIACVTVYKRLHLMFGTVVNQNMDIWQRKIIFRTSLVEISIINTNPHFLVLLGDRNDVGQPGLILLYFNQSRLNFLGYFFLNIHAKLRLEFPSLLPHRLEPWVDR